MKTNTRSKDPLTGRLLEEQGAMLSDWEAKFDRADADQDSCWFANQWPLRARRMTEYALFLFPAERQWKGFRKWLRSSNQEGTSDLWSLLKELEQAEREDEEQWQEEEEKK